MKSSFRVFSAPSKRVVVVVAEKKETHKNGVVSNVSADSVNKVKSAVCLQGDLLNVSKPLEVVGNGYTHVVGFATVVRRDPSKVVFCPL